MSTSESTDPRPVSAVLDAYERDVRSEVATRWNAWVKDLSNTEVTEVAGGLLARQGKLAIDVVRNPTLWTGHAAPLFLRAMADVHITFTWIAREPIVRSRAFIQYALGQVKLDIEKRKARWAKGKSAEPEEQAMVEFFEKWIDSQRYAFLTEVNVGSWAGKSVRDMAQEAGLNEFYDYVYSPFSACAHSMWHHVERYNLSQCDNPLHRWHRVPTILEGDVGADYALLAAKYFEKTIRVFDSTYCSEVDHPSSHDNLLDGLTEALHRHDDEA